MGLGEKGRNKVKTSKDSLFTKTEKAKNEIGSKSPLESDEPSVRKQFMFSQSINEQLRLCAFTQRRKEVDIVREALELYFASQKG